MFSGPLIAPSEVVRWLGKAVILDARAGPDAILAYGTAHVSGAVWADLETDLSESGDPSVGGRHPLPSLDAWLARVGRWGVTPSTPVFVYDAAGGGMAAARAWWMLRAVGHESVAVVDGGWQALCEAGIPIETDDAHPKPAAPYPTRVASWPSVDSDFVEGVRSDPSWRVIDARAHERYTGQSEPLDPIAGHIPGAHHLYWKSLLDHEDVFASSEVLRKRFAQILGSSSPEQVVCYCGSGVTACHLLLAMDACGLSGAKLYVGSWSEWCRQGRPRAAE